MKRGLRWRPLLGGLLVLTAAVFLGLTIARHWADLARFDWNVRWGLLLASVIALTAVLGWGVVVWKAVLDRFDHPPVPLRQLFRIWYLSNLARYVPGKVWQFVGAAELARIAGISRSVILTSMIVHVGFSLLSAAVVASLLLEAAASVRAQGFILASLAVGSLAVVHPAVLNRLLAVVAAVSRRPVLRWRGRWRDGLWLLALSVGSWILYGAAFALFVHSVAGAGAQHALPLAGVNALSFLAGYLVVLAPAGLGAREGVMALLLRPFAPPGVAALVAVLSRLWTVAAELLGAALVLAIRGGPAVAPPDGSAEVNRTEG